MSATVTQRRPRGPCSKCKRYVAFKKDGMPYGHKCVVRCEWDCYVAFRAGRKCKHGRKGSDESK